MKSFLMGLLGLGLGMSLGMLLAPMRGEDLRQTISDRAGEVADSARERVEQVRGTANNVIGAIRSNPGPARTGTEG